MVSAGYFDQDGILRNTGFKRYSSRLSLDGRLSNRIRFSLNFSPSFSVTDSVQGDGRWNEGAIGSALALPGFSPVKTEAGLYPSCLDFGFNSFGAYNPVSLVEEARGQGRTLRVINNANVSVDLIKDLTYTLKAGVGLNDPINRFQGKIVSGRVDTT